VCPNRGITVSYCDMTDMAAVEAACTDCTKLMWVESPTNPSLKLCDIKAIVAVGKRRNVQVCVGES
jgi:cystathionine gamma-lyase